MKDYIKAGFGITIGFALAEFVVKAVNAVVKAAAKTIENESEKKSDE